MFIKYSIIIKRLLQRISEFIQENEILSSNNLDIYERLLKIVFRLLIGKFNTFSGYAVLTILNIINSFSSYFVKKIPICFPHGHSNKFHCTKSDVHIQAGTYADVGLMITIES
jgi:hypothetical protein